MTRKVVRLRDGQEPIHVRGEPRMVDDEDGSGSLVDQVLDAVRVHVVGARIDVGEARNEELVEHAGEAPHVGDGRCDHLAAGSKPQGPKGDMNGSGSR